MDASSPIDRAQFRQVLGHYPTGVTVITARSSDGSPVAMVIGSFTSVSLDPPLIAFLPAKSSRTYAGMDIDRGFCVNIVGAGDEDLVRTITTRTRDPFDSRPWHDSPNGMPVLDEAIAWIACRTDRIVEAGDHFIVLGRVLALEAGATALPLVFFKGGYGRFAPTSLVAIPQADISSQLRLAHIARPEMERLADTLKVEVTCNARVDDCLVVLASAGNSDGVSSWVGLRSPALPPISAIYVAWSSKEAVASWMTEHGDIEPGMTSALLDSIGRLRERGWAISLSGPATKEMDAVYREVAKTALTADSATRLRRTVPRAIGEFNPEIVAGQFYAVRVIAAPVFDVDSNVALTLQLRCNGTALTSAQIESHARILMAAADRVTARIGGQQPLHGKSPN